MVNPLQDCLVARAAATPGFAMDFQYGEKMDGAANACQQEGIKFLPIVAESFGGWHAVEEREIKKLIASKARHAGQEEADAIRHAFTRLSILIM